MPRLFPLNPSKSLGRVSLALASGFLLAAISVNAEARCKSLVIVDALSICNTGVCPPGEYIYSVILRNKAKKRLYVAYRFQGPDGRLTRGGLDIAPESDIERPIGFGRAPITIDEPDVTRRGRFRASQCGFNERTKFSWRK